MFSFLPFLNVVVKLILKILFLTYSNIFKDSDSEELEDIASKILAEESYVVTPIIQSDIEQVHLQKQVQGVLFFKGDEVLFGSFKQNSVLI